MDSHRRKPSDIIETFAWATRDAAARAPRGRDLSTSVPILMYHQVTPHPPPGFQKYAISTATFAAHMGWLASSGYSTIDLDDLVRSGHGDSLPHRPVIITFDDGYADCFEHAVPVLQAHGFVAVFYLVAGLMGGTTRWLARERGLDLPLMTWFQARSLVADGFQCGAHSMTHPRLSDMPETACREELSQSRLVLEQQLGCEIRHMAYPHGVFNDVVRGMAAACGYSTAASATLGLSRPDDDLLALPRLHISGVDSVRDFAWRLRHVRTPRELLHMRADALRRRLGGLP